MQNKIELLLKQINIDEEDKKYFNEASLDKIICNKNKDKYAFCITIKNALPLKTYINFNEKLKNKYSNAIVTSVLKADNFKLENIIEYYRYYIEKYSKEAPLLKEFIDSKLSLEENILYIEIINKAEEMKIESIIKQLEKDLNNSGFQIKIQTKINEEKAEEIREEIEKTKVIPKVTKKIESPIIIGEEIKTEVSPINTITFEMDSVTVKAKIFAVDTFESSKSNFKIITLKITDGTDSMYAKIFTREDKEYSNYLKRIKSGSNTYTLLSLLTFISNIPISSSPSNISKCK